MSHNHSHGETKNIRSAFFLNLSFTIIEIIGGVLTNSMAIIADAIHDLGDSISLGLAWYLQKLSNKGRNEKFSYGYRRFSVLGALITSIFLIIGSIVIFIKTIPRFLNPQETNTQGMILLAILGVIVNGLAVLRLKKGESLNERVVMLHLLEDVLGWVAVLIGSIIMYFFDVPWIDPLLSILIALFVLKNVYGNLKKVIRIIMQGVPEVTDLNEVKKVFDDSEKIISHHDLHVWTMDGEYGILTVHLVVDHRNSHSAIMNIKKELRNTLYQKMNIKHATLEVEFENDECTYNQKHE